MVRKTAVRALAPYLPKSTDLGRAIEADEQRVEHIAGVHELVVTRESTVADSAPVVADSAPTDPAHPDYVEVSS
jgi:recombination protein RecT